MTTAKGGRPKGRPLPESHREAILEAQLRSNKFQNAVVEAGEAVLRTAAEEPEKVSAVAQSSLRRIRREFRGDPLLFRILPPEDDGKD
jgi:hypothetical protein